MSHIESYRQIQPLYDTLCGRLKDLLVVIAKSEGLDFHAIEGRVKSSESFEEKISRPGKNYVDPLNDIKDLCGMRVILYYQDDVARFAQLVRKAFVVDDANSVDKRSELNSDQFGYMSVHLVCQIDKSRAEMVEWASLRGLSFEIQVRTVLQHAWASIYHALQYKNSNGASDDFARKFSRVAGLLELSDEQFSELRVMKGQLRAETTKSIARDDLDLSINSVSLDEYLRSSDVVANIVRYVRKNKLSVSREPSVVQLFKVVANLKMESLTQLDEVLSAFEKYASDFFAVFKSFQGTELVSGDFGHWCAVAVVAIKHREVYSFILEDKMWGKDYLEEVVEASRRVGI